MTLAWDLLVWLGVALVLLGLRTIAKLERRRGYDEGWSDATEHHAGTYRPDAERREPG